MGATLHGPFFFFGFKAVDALWGAAAKDVKTVLLKTATGQARRAPPLLHARCCALPHPPL